MHKYMKKIIYIAISFIVSLTSCKGTWLMYDTSQKDRIAFIEVLQTHTASFALIAENEIRVSAEVFLMGQPSERERKFVFEPVPVPENDSIKIGNLKYKVVSARPNVDYSLGELSLPAGAVSAKFDIILHRTKEMSGGNYLRVGLKIVENDEFAPVSPDSSSTRTIITPYYYIYVNDGDPACPFWWIDGKNSIGWHYDLGRYYPEKFRRMLKLMHDTKDTNPIFYEYCVSHCGYNLDAEPDKALNNNMVVFWRQAYSSAWAKYVFIPMFEHYKQYYSEHPDDPNFELMGSEYVNRKARIGWGNPHSGKYGFFN